MEGFIDGAFPRDVVDKMEDKSWRMPGGVSY
jgi:hypothetical protein